MVSRIVGIIALGMLVLGGSIAYAGVDAGDLCKEKKAKAAGKKAFDFLKAFGKNQKKPNAAKLDSDISKAQSKFTKFFSKADAVGGVSCPVTGDAGDVEVVVDDCVDELYNMISGGTTGPRFVDNGDGTITDNQTGLMWEKKVASSGCLHCVDDYYPWEPGEAFGYTSMFDWVSEVNGLSWDGTTQTGLGGHSDWRIPSGAELQTILDMSQGFCGGGTGACIDPIFGPTASDYYWSSTTYAANPYYAWGVHFYYGSVGFVSKPYDAPVRAVRGGS